VQSPYLCQKSGHRTGIDQQLMEIPICLFPVTGGHGTIADKISLGDLGEMPRRVVGSRVYKRETFKNGPHFYSFEIQLCVNGSYPRTSPRQGLHQSHGFESPERFSHRHMTCRKP